MKKLLMFAGLGLAALVLFVVSVVVVVRMRGGVSEGLANAPVVGGLLGAGDTAGQAADATAVPQKAQREATFLRFGSQTRLDRLADELQAKQAEWEQELRDLERRARELDAWERQLKEERDLLRATFAKAQQDLARDKDDLARREAELARGRVAITQAEQSNLKAMADLYAKMDPQRAAEIVTTMFTGGQQDTAVKLLHLMSDRSGAKVMQEIVDPQMGAQITEMLKRVVSEAAPGG